MSLTKTDLSQFIGTDNYWRHWTGMLVLTDGVRYLADKAQAHWLIDAIASYQTLALLKERMLQQFQAWKLTVDSNHTATLACERDLDDLVLTQNIPLTDFPLDEITLYLVKGVLMLPSEY